LPFQPRAEGERPFLTGLRLEEGSLVGGGCLRGETEVTPGGGHGDAAARRSGEEAELDQVGLVDVHHGVGVLGDGGGEGVEADGTAMRVSAALAIINDVLGEVLDGEEAELDHDTRFALTWFAEHQYEPGSSGDAESVAKAKNTSLDGLGESGIGEARGGKFRLYRRDELRQHWSPVEDDRFTIWEALQYLVAALERSESEAADLLHTLGGNGDRARQLAYLLYQKANDRGWAAEANAYNSCITAWPSLREGALAAAARATEPVEGQMFAQ